MAQIVSKGDSVYECDVCNRRTRVPLNKYSFDVVQRCIITQSCPGKLHRVIQNKDINSTPAITPAVAGLQDWFQRRVLFTHQQQIESSEWRIIHNLGNHPTIQVFVKQLVDGNVVYTETSTFTVRTVDLNTTYITFPAPIAGLAQCVSYTSRNKTNAAIQQPTVAAVRDDFQLSNRGEITIATLIDSPSIALTVSYRHPATSIEYPVLYPEVDDSPSVLSPWIGASIVFIAGKRYTVRSFNITPTDNTALPAVNGSQLSFTMPAPGGVGKNLILLGVPPFSVPDRVINEYIDIATLSTTQPEVYYNAGEIHSAPQVIKSVYPLIVAVD
jgi:hypothetical protein